MNPKYVRSPRMPIADARRRQAIRYAFLCVGLFCLLANNAWAQTISPEARQLFRQADASADLNQKIRFFESALRLSPQYVDARLELAKSLIQSQQFRRAVFQLDTVLSKNIKNVEAWFYKGRAHAEIGENNTARKSFEQALVLYVELGKAQLANQSFDTALQSFERGIEIAISTKDNAKQAEAWYWKGRAHEAQGDTANAAKSYRQSLRVQPDFKEARTYLSRIENQSKLEALYQAAKAARLRSDWTTAAQNYQQIFVVDPNFKEVSQKLAIVQNKIKAQALADSAQALRQQQKFDAAIVLLQQAINLDAERRPDFQAQINQIEQARQLAGNKIKAMKPAPPKELSASSSQKDSSAADTTSKRAPIALVDSTNRQPVKLISEKRSLPSALKWLVAIVATIVVIFVLVRIGKYRTKSKPPESTITLPFPQEPSPPESMRDLIKVIMTKQLQATPLPANIIHPELKRFRIDRLLGRGGMGRVYKAYDRKLNRSVALKVIINPENMLDQSQFDELLKRFQREAQNTAQLSHPNIVNLYEFYDERDGEFFMTMEYIEGATVMQLLQEKKRLSLREVIPIIKQTCEALEYAHKKDVILIHRDIKPSNIMLNLEAMVKVVDFGIAKALSSQETPFTELGGRLGTPDYMSPEQLNAEELDRRTDIFSLGLVFYQMLAGELPPKEIRRSKPVPKLSAMDRSIPARIDAIIAKMLAPDRAQRYQNAGEIIEELK